jgi:hypothetical protein
MTLDVISETLPPAASTVRPIQGSIMLPTFLAKAAGEFNSVGVHRGGLPGRYVLQFSKPITLVTESGEMIAMLSDGNILFEVTQNAARRISCDMVDTKAREANFSRSRRLFSLMRQAQHVEDLFSALAKNVSDVECCKALFRVEIPKFRTISLEAALLVLADSGDRMQVTEACEVIASTLLRDAHVAHSSAAVSIGMRIRTFNGLFNKVFPVQSERKQDIKQLIIDAVRRECGDSAKTPVPSNLTLLEGWI